MHASPIQLEAQHRRPHRKPNRTHPEPRHRGRCRRHEPPDRAVQLLRAQIEAIDELCSTRPKLDGSSYRSRLRSSDVSFERTTEMISSKRSVISAKLFGRPQPYLAASLDTGASPAAGSGTSTAAMACASKADAAASSAGAESTRRGKMRESRTTRPSTPLTKLADSCDRSLSNLDGLVDHHASSTRSGENRSS